MINYYKNLKYMIVINFKMNNNKKIKLVNQLQIQKIKLQD